MNLNQSYILYITWIDESKPKLYILYITWIDESTPKLYIIYYLDRRIYTKVIYYILPG